MKNKKGFTLIELLAVIVILAIIALIATPIILNMINDAKKSASVDSAYGYIEAIEFNNSMAQIDNKKYTLINDGTDIDVNTIGNIGIKGTTPESGKVSITKGRIIKATLCINSYNVEYDGKEAKVKGKCNEEETNLETNDSLLGYVAKKTLKNNTYETIKIKDETYTAHVYNYNGNQTWTSDMTFGDSNDVATNNENAKNMVIVKVNGDLTINGGVTVTAYASEEGYGGPKGLFIYVTGTLTNNGTISMTARGAKAEGQNVYLFKNSDGSYEYVPKKGANGGSNIAASAIYYYSGGWYYNIASGNNGNYSNGRELAGGGSGSVNVSVQNHVVVSNKGGDGTSYSGGTGSGETFSVDIYTQNPSFASNTGGQGGNGYSKETPGYGPTYGSGGTGNPGGFGYSSIGTANQTKEISKNGSNGTGGLIIIYANKFNNDGLISSDGTDNLNNGGASGAGSINIFAKNIEKKGNYSTIGGKGTISEIPSYKKKIKGGDGGNGSVTIGTMENNKFKIYNPENIKSERILVYKNYQLEDKNCNFKTTDENIIKVDTNGLITSMANGTTEINLYDNNDKLLKKYIARVNMNPITITKNIYNGSVTNYPYWGSQLFDEIYTKQGKYGTLNMGPKPSGSSYYFTVEEDLYITFTSNYYSDSLGPSGQMVEFNKIDENGNETEYIKFQQKNNTQKYNKQFFTKGNYVVRNATTYGYVVFDEWDISYE